MTAPIPRPVAHLNALCKQIPDLSQGIDMMLAYLHAEGYAWPSYCFIPIAFWDWAAERLLGEKGKGESIDFATRLGCVATWRYTQSIYRFDKTLADAVYDTPLEGVIPLEVLFRLPEWSVYVELPEGMEFEKKPLYGFWAMLDHNPVNHDRTLLLLLDKEGDLAPFFLELTENSTIEEIMYRVEELAPGANPFAKASAVASLLSAWKICLPPLLYLCSEKPDLIDRKEPDWLPHPPKPKKVKGGFRLFPAKRTRIVEVGSVLGETLRKAESEHYQTETGGTRTVKSHLRRAHWHSFWTGPRKDPKPGDQKLVLRWLSPILVHGRSDDGLSAPFGGEA